MSRKTWYLAAVLILLLLTPQILRAEDGLSLESLLDRVETLFQGQDDLKARMAAVETQIAPTPTKTPRPTSTPRIDATATASAKATAQSRFRIRATATAVARSRATAQVQKGANEADIAVYSKQIFPILADLQEGLLGAGELMNSPELTDSVWNYKMDLHIGQIQTAAILAWRVTPPTSLKDVHKVFLQGMDECMEAANNIHDGVIYHDVTKLESAAEPLEECVRLLEKAAEMFDAARSQ